VYDFHIYDRLFENSIEKSIEKEQKEFRALLISKGFFESEIQSKRGKLWASKFFGHNNPRGKKFLCDIIKPLRCRANVERGNIEKTSEPRFTRFTDFAFTCKRAYRAELSGESYNRENRGSDVQTISHSPIQNGDNTMKSTLSKLAQVTAIGLATTTSTQGGSQ
jgi:hypothetical protein